MSVQNVSLADPKLAELYGANLQNNIAFEFSEVTQADIVELLAPHSMWLVWIVLAIR